jgi:multiple sugar transport system ATP-binding protein
MVFQSYALYPHMSVKDNIAFPLKAANMPKAAQQERIAWAAGILGIDHLLGRKPRQLSGGQRQRVPWRGRSSASPTSSSSTSRSRTWTPSGAPPPATSSSSSSGGSATTTIYVTHDQVEAMGHGRPDRRHGPGHSPQLGPAGGDLRRAGRHLRRHLRRLAADEPGAGPGGGDLLGFRPEHFQPAPSGVDGVARFPFHVHRLEYLGAERLLYGEVGEAKVVARFPVTVPIPVEPGATAEFARPPQH